MDKLIKKTNPDLICFTGDQTMSEDSPKLYEKLKGWVEAHKIPWTLVFGNHDTDFDVPYEALLEPLKMLSTLSSIKVYRSSALAIFSLNSGKIEKQKVYYSFWIATKKIFI